MADMTILRPSNRVLRLTRSVAGLVIPFLVLAFIILYIFPRDTERLFAWKIQPPMTAMMLAAAYAGGIYFFTRVLMTNEWHKVHVGFPPVFSFASLLGIATILHWDRFTHNHISFIAWAGLYFTTPFIVLAAWLRNRLQDTHTLEADDIALPLLVRAVIGAVGAFTLLIGLILFLVPGAIIAVWPWALTPLTARVMGAMFSLPGVVGLCIALDRRWSSAQIILQAQGFSILLILLAALRSFGDFDWTNIIAWLFVGGLTVFLMSIVLLSLAMEIWRRSPRPSPAATG
jgi:hypothetical protein